jgi:hypothetical protein
MPDQGEEMPIVSSHLHRPLNYDRSGGQRKTVGRLSAPHIAPISHSIRRPSADSQTPFAFCRFHPIHIGKMRNAGRGCGHGAAMWSLIPWVPDRLAVAVPHGLQGAVGAYAAPSPCETDFEGQRGICGDTDNGNVGSMCLALVASETDPFIVGTQRFADQGTPAARQGGDDKDGAIPRKLNRGGSCDLKSAGLRNEENRTYRNTGITTQRSRRGLQVRHAWTSAPCRSVRQPVKSIPRCSANGAGHSPPWVRGKWRAHFWRGPMDFWTWRSCSGHRRDCRGRGPSSACRDRRTGHRQRFLPRKLKPWTGK